MLPWLLFSALIAYLLLQVGYILFILCRCRADRRYAPTPQPYTCGDPTATTCCVLVHGFADGPQAWQREADALAALGYYVVVPHLSHDEDVEAWRSHIEATLRTLKKTHARILLWGHSMGGAIAWMASQTVNVDALILWAPYCAPKLGKRLTLLFYALHCLFFLYPYTPTFFPSMRHGKGAPETTYRIRQIISRKTFYSVLTLPCHLSNMRIVTPTILLLSQRDTVVDNRATMQRFATATRLWAHDAMTGHALTNAADWQENLHATLNLLSVL